ncbi:MAG: DUF4861 family protein, partial [Woeseiaceae bacterium]
MRYISKPAFLLALLLQTQIAAGDEVGGSRGWYSQGDFEPTQRVELIVHNALDRERHNSPVTIRRDHLAALPDVHELAITLVDPDLPGRPEPSAELLQRQGGHEARRENNGAWIPYQLDDFDQDGLWDELFFMSDFAPDERKVFYLYVGFQDHGWQAHRTHAGIGSYVRHTVPFWEAENVGWKLWFPTDIDVYGKRRPILMSNRMYMDNLDGYGVSTVDPAFGSDIMQVDNSFGGGGAGVFEDSKKPNVVSRPRFTPRSLAATKFNAGPRGDTRYAFTVLANGPVRSVIRARTFNWDSGSGRYEIEQIYSAYAGQSFSTSRVKFTKFEPESPDATFAVGIRKHLDESSSYMGNGIVISGAPEAIRNLDDEGLRENSLMVDFVGTALVVPAKYSPEYVFVPAYSENHTFRIRPNKERTFEYLVAAGWSEGSVNRTAAEFQDYVLHTAEEFNSPLELAGARAETREPATDPIVSIEGDMFLINGSPTYEGRYWNGHRIEGLLLNARLVQGIFDDANPETRHLFRYPDTGTWDPDRNTDEFVAAMPAWAAYGLNSFTLNVQGGSPTGYGNKAWSNSAFTSSGDLKPEYMRRLTRILDKAQELKMIVILGYFYFGQDQNLKDEAAVVNAVDRLTDWLLDIRYRNVLVEIDNECDVGAYDHEILKCGRVDELISRVQSRRRNGRSLLASTSFKGGSIPTENVVAVADFILMHGNGVDDPDEIRQMVADTRALPAYS